MEKIAGSKCKFCDLCDGKGCTGELPGMGGENQSVNFVLNCSEWQKYAIDNWKSFRKLGTELEILGTELEQASIRLAPITGAVQNLGYSEEKPWYFDIIEACIAAKIPLSIGDGAPDEKLLYGIESLNHHKAKGAVFLKPYSDEKLLERIDWAGDVAEIFGIDIDSYAIVTMRNQVKLEKKSATQLRFLKDECRSRANVPFAIKGIFSEEDVALVREVRPDIVVVSNHGGRVPARQGSTVAFLAEMGTELARYCGEVWVDGGVRQPQDLVTARRLGASTVLIGRPFATALMKGGKSEVFVRAAQLRGTSEDLDSYFISIPPKVAIPVK